MDKKVIKEKAVEIMLNTNSAKEINSKVKDLQESGIEKEKAIEICNLAKDLRKQRLETIKVQVNSLKYDGIRTLSTIFKAEFLSKDWKDIAKKNTRFAKVESLENFLLSYYSKVTISGKLVIVSTIDKETKEKEIRERNLSKINAQSVWNNCIDNVLRETKGNAIIQTIYKDTEIVTIEMQDQRKAEKAKK